jgi:hypothetical protein
LELGDQLTRAKAEATDEDGADVSGLRAHSAEGSEAVAGLDARLRRLRSMGWVLPYVPAFLAALPFLVLAVRVIIGHRDPIYSGDAGLLALGVHDAAHGARTLGPYSQFGFFHPGPALFYALSPFEWITGDAPWAIPFGIEILNALVASSVVLVVQRSKLSRFLRAERARDSGLRRDADRSFVIGLVAALLVVGYSLAVGVGLLQIFWNPIQIMLPVALVLVASALTDGWGWSAAAMLVAATFAVQTDLSTIPVVGVAVICGLTFIGWDQWRFRGRRAERSGEGHLRSQWWRTSKIVGPLVLLALAVAVWIPPLVQQVTNHPGNAGKLVTFFRSTNPSHPSWVEASAYLGRQLAVIPERIQDFGGLSMAASHGHRGQAQLGVFLALAVGLIAVGVVRHSRPLTRLGIVSLVSALVALTSITAIRGQGGWYYTAWMSAIALPLLLGWAVLVIHLLAKVATVLVPAGLLVVSVSALIASATTAVDDNAAFPNEPGYRANTLAVWKLISGPLEQMRVRQVVLGGDPGLMPTLSGIALRMRLSGLTVRVPSTLIPPFGPEEDSPVSATPAILITTTDPGGDYVIVGRLRSEVSGFPVATVSLLSSKLTKSD